VVTNEQPPPGDHGGDGLRVAEALGLDPASVLDLSQSLNPVAPDVAEVVVRHLDELGRYPDERRAHAALAEAFGIDGDRLVLTNGGSEAIALVAAELGRGWVDEPDFSLYHRHLPVIERGAPRFRSNPHNPTGLLAAPGDRAAVWDEAFYPLSTGRWTRGDADRGSIVVGSLTKLFACPGLRIGYVVAPDMDAAARIRYRRPEWSVNGLAVGALPELLERTDLPAWSRAVAGLRAELAALLARHDLVPSPADANWLLVRAPDLRWALLPRGIVVRDCANFGMPGVVRIAVPDERGLARLADALDAIDA
jgi:histidinol-phosphate/aromatic aminotransferase/cobyric acid decarboxylase-like protein